MGYSTTEVLGQIQGSATATVDQGDGSTLTEVSGSNRYLLIRVHSGYAQGNSTTGRDDSHGPASITVGGQTLNLVEESSEFDGTGNNEGVAIYAANEATVAAMTFTAGEADWSIIWDHSGAYLRICADWYTDIDQTAGIVASGHSTGTTTTQTVSSLSVTVGDLVLGSGTVAYNLTLTTSDTSRDAGTSGGTNALNSKGILAEKTAASTTESISLTVGDGSEAAMIAIVLRPAAPAGGGGTSERGRGRGRQRGRNRGRAHRMAVYGWEYINGIWQRPRLVAPVGITLQGA